MGDRLPAAAPEEFPGAAMPVDVGSVEDVTVIVTGIEVVTMVVAEPEIRVMMTAVVETETNGRL